MTTIDPIVADNLPPPLILSANPRCREIARSRLLIFWTVCRGQAGGRRRDESPRCTVSRATQSFQLLGRLFLQPSNPARLSERAIFLNFNTRYFSRDSLPGA